MMALAGTVLAMLGVVAAPHVLDLRRAQPATAMALWGSALVMRALLVVSTVAALVVVVPRTAVFGAITHWCWHTVLPLIATHLGLNGHRLGDAALILPAALVGVSVVSVIAGIIRATRSVRDLVERGRIARGPRESVVIKGPEILVATAGFARPRVLVSAGALVHLDDEELAASLDHEHGHIARHHRWLLLSAELCRAVARFVPGSRRVAGELRLHVERDADQWALRRQHDPLALASAICKAALSRRQPVAGLLALEGAGLLEDRLEELSDGGAPPIRRRAHALFAVASCAVTLAVAAALPAATAAARGPHDAAVAERHCAD
jgi:Zn-dependent protease with chaperone function